MKHIGTQDKELKYINILNIISKGSKQIQFLYVSNVNFHIHSKSKFKDFAKFQQRYIYKIFKSESYLPQFFFFFIFIRFNLTFFYLKGIVRSTTSWDMWYKKTMQQNVQDMNRHARKFTTQQRHINVSLKRHRFGK